MIEFFDWRQHAACKYSDPELFYPNAGVSAKAMEVCSFCPVAKECLDEVLATERPLERWGIWGGMSADQREVEYDGKPVRLKRCRAGHDLTDDNTVVVGNRKRCRTCSEVKVTPQVSRTYCRHGHEWVPSNVVIRVAANGRERELCRQCERNRSAEYKQRNSA